MQKETIATHFGYDAKANLGSMAVPIHLATAYDFGDAQTAANRFALKELGLIYTRLSNPTTNIFESRIAALEGGVAGVATSSGQSALFGALVNLAGAGDEIIYSDKVYGGTMTLISVNLKRLGINSKTFDAENPQNLADLITDKTKAIVFETLSNPQISVAKIDEIVKIADKFGIVTIADNTVATPIIFTPIAHGADVITHSASKYISGQGLSIAGVAISAKSLNKKLVGNARYPYYNEPDEGYHGLILANLAENFDLFSLRFKISVLRDFGMTLSPFNAFQLIQGLETLDVRVRRHSQNALKIAEFLENHPKVKSVNYPGLKSSKFYDYVNTNFTDGLCSGLLCFDVGDFKTAKNVADNTNIFSIVVNIGDSKSLISHSASTTHSQLSEAELQQAGISQGLIRLSIGLENADDLIADLDGALK
ncbi:MAG: O-acetylhomoserine aminocarboxypropyltransferase/cysteine synthase family protein [Campylobacter sp.]